VDGSGILHLFVRNKNSSTQNVKLWGVLVIALKLKGYDLLAQNIFGATALHEVRPTTKETGY
jgi:hypothetical protein